MRTQINGQDARWNEAIWQLWHTFVETADPKLTDAKVTDANYFLPHRYVDEYDRGDMKEGFLFTVVFQDGKRDVSMHVISGGQPWQVARPPIPSWAREARTA